MLRSFVLRYHSNKGTIVRYSDVYQNDNYNLLEVLFRSYLYDRVLSSNAFSVAKEVSQLVPDDYFIYLGIPSNNFVQAGVQFLSILTLVLLLDIFLVVKRLLPGIQDYTNSQFDYCFLGSGYTLDGGHWLYHRLAIHFDVFLIIFTTYFDGGSLDTSRALLHM